MTPLATPGKIVDLQQLAAGHGDGCLTLLVKTHDVRISHVLIPAGQDIPTYEAEGEVILHCLRGHISVTALGETRQLQAGQLLYLVINEPFSTHGIEDASLLVTIMQPKRGLDTALIGD